MSQTWLSNELSRLQSLILHLSQVLLKINSNLRSLLVVWSELDLIHRFTFRSNFVTLWFEPTEHTKLLKVALIRNSTQYLERRMTAFLDQFFLKEASEGFYRCWNNLNELYLLFK